LFDEHEGAATCVAIGLPPDAVFRRLGLDAPPTRAEKRQPTQTIEHRMERFHFDREVDRGPGVSMNVGSVFFPAGGVASRA